MNYIFEFICMAIPKAGIIFKELPFNLSTVMLPLIALFNYKEIIRFMSKRKFFFYYIIFILFIVMINLYKILFYGKNTFFMAVSLIYLFAPLMIVVGYSMNTYNFYRVMKISTIVVSLFSIIQYLFGIENTAIYGLTIALGDSYKDKSIGLGMSDFAEAIKMPSTYQNGNGVGIFLAMAVIAIIFDEIKEEKRSRWLKIIAIVLGMIGIGLSGSRAILYPLVFFLVIKFKSIYGFIHKGMKKYSQQIRIFLFILFLIFICFLLYYLTINNSGKIITKSFINRYLTTTLNDSTGAGRTVKFSEYIYLLKKSDFFEFLEYMIFGSNWVVFSGGDILTILINFGVITTLMFWSMLLYVNKKLIKIKNWECIGLLSVFVAFLIDSSYNYTPALTNYFLISGYLLNKNNC